MPRHTLLVLALTTLIACADRDADRTTPTWTLRETVRIGSGDEGPTSFSWIKGVATDSLDRIFIYEHSTQDIRVFSRDGQYLKTIGRRGRGPGELANAEGIVVAPDGALWIRDAGNGRFSRLTIDGAYLDVRPNFFCTSQGTWMPVLAPDGIVDEDCVVVPNGVEYRVFKYRTDRVAIDTLGVRPECGTRALAESAVWITKHQNGTTYRQIPFAPRAHHAVAADGAVWCVPNSAAYELTRLTLAGDTVRVARSVVAVPVTAPERDSIIADIESSGPTGVDFSRIPTQKPAITRLTMDDAGRLWVRRDVGVHDLLFDLIRADGTLEATVSLSGVRTNTWSPFVVRGDDVYLVILGEDDVPQVGRFRITRGE